MQQVKMPELVLETIHGEVSLYTFEQIQRRLFLFLMEPLIVLHTFCRLPSSFIGLFKADHSLLTAVALSRRD